MLTHDATLRFTFSDVTHQVSLVPTDLPGSEVTRADRRRAGHSLRQPLTREQRPTAKTPAWLNNRMLYHNRGDSTYAGESATYGDFSGLDDLFTEQGRVVNGMEDIYKTWVDFGIDGFRIDTAKHVNTEFWQQFSPAMLDEAAAIDNPDFFMFGEVYDAGPKFQSIYSTEAKLPATVDFGFQAQSVAVTNGKPTSGLADMFAGDDYYTDTDSNAYDLPSPIDFTVDTDGLVTTFSYDSTSQELSVGTSAASIEPDLSTADAYWIDDRTIAYPIDRLWTGVDPAWLRYRLSWGDLVIDASSLGGESASVNRLSTGPNGCLALGLDPEPASRINEIKGAPITAIGVYDDAQRLVDATGVAP